MYTIPSWISCNILHKRVELITTSWGRLTGSIVEISDQWVLIEVERYYNYLPNGGKIYMQQDQIHCVSVQNEASEETISREEVVEKDTEEKNNGFELDATREQ